MTGNPRSLPLLASMCVALTVACGSDAADPMNNPPADGTADGADGWGDGTADGAGDGTADGNVDGTADGNVDGSADGNANGSDGGDTGDGDDGTPGSCDLGAYAGTDNVAPSQNPPCNIPVAQAPLFVSIGWDDNGDAEGMAWATSILRDRGVTATFFNTTTYGSNSAVVSAWKEAQNDGNETGNHTVSHLPGHGGNTWSADQWMPEVADADAFLISNGVVSDVFGFRTPYLEYSDGTLTVVDGLGYWYDASIEEGYEYDQDGSNFFWPYTLDNLAPGHSVQVEWGSKTEITAHPGLWELPVYTVIAPEHLRSALAQRQTWFDAEGGKITGFDYNLWVGTAIGGFQMSKQEFLDTLKNSFDLRRNGNRAPLLFGAHTAYYVDSYSANTPNASTADRRAAIEEFLDYVLQFPEVRVVSHKEILDWMRNPKPL